jgi:hypothetical protein
MNKQTFITALLALVAMTGQGQTKVVSPKRNIPLAGEGERDGVV